MERPPRDPPKPSREARRPAPAPAPDGVAGAGSATRRRLAAWRAVALFFAVTAVVATFYAVRTGQRQPPAEPIVGPEPPPPLLALWPARFDDLPGWAEDRLEEALPSLMGACRSIAALPDDRPLKGAEVAGRAADWRSFCTAVVELASGDGPALRRLIERELRPWTVADRTDPTGFFTGYFEPTLRGSRQRTGPYVFPLYVRPPELVTVDLSRFRDDLQGRRIAGRLDGSTLVPFADRAAIDGGALGGRDLELVWVDDAVDAFFLHIQGSGRVELDDGTVLRVGYAAQNGHPYYAIGRELIERGELSREEVSLQTIRAWLAAHPDEASAVMHRNPSYVFFRRLRQAGPLGSLGTVLTPGRSLAVDRSFLPLGAPLWISTRAPDPRDPGAEQRVERLVVAEDTGGAIRGPTRADLFWGPGEAAAVAAGGMKHEGRLWLLRPRHLGRFEGAAGDPPTTSR